MPELFAPQSLATFGITTVYAAGDLDRGARYLNPVLIFRNLDASLVASNADRCGSSIGSSDSTVWMWGGVVAVTGLTASLGGHSVSAHFLFGRSMLCSFRASYTCGPSQEMLRYPQRENGSAAVSRSTRSDIVLKNRDVMGGGRVLTLRRHPACILRQGRSGTSAMFASLRQRYVNLDIISERASWQQAGPVTL